MKPYTLNSPLNYELSLKPFPPSKHDCCETLKQRVAILETKYRILETALTQLELANQQNIKQRDLVYQKLGELLVEGRNH